jgi:hypothetical protein
MYNRARFPATSFHIREGIFMILKKIVGAGAIAGALSFSALGLAGAANAAPTPQTTTGVVHQAELAGWGGGRGGGGGFHGGGGRGFGGPGFGRGGPGFNRGFGGPGFGRGFGGPGFGRGFGGPPCLIGLCI